MRKENISMGKKLIVGVNDLATTHPNIAKEWDYEKNGNLKPENISAGSATKIWWLCSKGHSYVNTVQGRARGQGCPYCSNRKILVGFNDLGTTHPEISVEWDYEKNGDLKPENIFGGSGKEVFWLCEKGHSYSITPNSRTTNKRGCPYCANRKVLPGYNDLESQNPNLAKEWNHEKNGNLKPDEVIYGSTKKVWWKCEKGHEWQATVSNRSRGTGCPRCSRELQSSFPEQAIFFYIKQAFPDAENGNRTAIGMELDIYIPSIKTAIEYDGYTWHSKSKSIENDVAKNNLCKQKNISLIRIREAGLPELENCICFERKNNKKEGLEEVICDVLKHLEVFNMIVDIDKDNSSILGNYMFREQEKSLSSHNPEVLSEWDYEKNGDLKPENITAKSGRKVWWICPKGHSYQSSINNRTMRKDGCPYCSKHKVILGESDLQTRFPEIAKEWDYDKNNIKPDEIAAMSNKKVWWKCKEGHSWEEHISKRTHSHTGCPICYKKQIELNNPPIVCVETGEIYRNAKEACKELEKPTNNVRWLYKNCGLPNKTCYGYHWRLATEEEKASIGLIETANKKTPKKIEFDSNRSDAYNKMTIDKVSQVMMPGEGMRISVIA